MCEVMHEVCQPQWLEASDGDHATDMQGLACCSALSILVPVVLHIRMHYLALYSACLCVQAPCAESLTSNLVELASSVMS